MPVKVGFRGFVGQLLFNITKVAEKASGWLWIRREGPWGGANRNRGLINRSWVAWVRMSDVERPETPVTAGYITDDVFRSIEGMDSINVLSSLFCL